MIALVEESISVVGRVRFLATYVFSDVLRPYGLVAGVRGVQRAQEQPGNEEKKDYFDGKHLQSTQFSSSVLNPSNGRPNINSDCTRKRKYRRNNVELFRGILS